MNIVLIGYRASGKSTIGRLLAEQLGLTFVDIDLDIMARYENRSVAEIWNEFGEAAYRETECDIMEDVCARENQIIALGGGTPMQPRAFAALESALDSTCFYLNAPAEVLYDRSMIDTDNTDNRPSLLSGGLEEVKLMLDKRQPTYLRLADHTIDVASQSLADAAAEIVQSVRGNG